MPKTKFQSVVFTAIMVFFMVYCMTVYTIAGNSGGLSYGAFAVALREMWAEYIVVFLLIFFVIKSLAKKLAFKIVSPGVDKPIFITLAIQSFTVCLIVPCITLFATFWHNGFTSQWFVQWAELIFKCFPAAFCLQVFLIGPLVRRLFKVIFKKQLAQ